MATDPVCGMEVEESSTMVAVVNRKKYFFCSNECRNAFLEKKA